MKISLCMIVKNEQNVIKQCLESIKNAVDEIIIVDTGSIDKTKEICYKYTKKIYDFKWVNDFSKARNYAISKATNNYILWLDADDYLLNEDLNKLISLKNNSKDDVDFYYFLYDFDSNYAPFYRERLFKKSKQAKFKGKVHEVITPFGNIQYVNIKIKQFDTKKGLTDRNLRIYESMNNKKLKTRDLYYYGRELIRHERIDEALSLFNRYVKRKDQYLEDLIDTYSLIAKIYIIKKDYQLALFNLYKTFIYDIPRLNILIEIANIYMYLNDYEKAIYYYTLSLKQIKNYKNKGFVYKDYLGYYQAISLCVCYFRIKKYKKSNYYNELAYFYKKDNPYYLNNKNILKNLLK